MRKLYIFEKDKKVEKRFLDLDIPFEKGIFEVWKIYGWKLQEVRLLDQEQSNKK